MPKVTQLIGIAKLPPSTDRRPESSPRPAASASAGSLSDMQMTRPHPRPAESEPLGIGPASYVLTSPAGDSEAGSV